VGTPQRSLFDRDISGYPIPSHRPGLMSSEAQDQLSIQDARTSVRLEHFQKIGERPASRPW
jgi:hypothetical protein